MLFQSLSAIISGFAIGFWKSWKMSLVMMSLTPLLAVCAFLMGKVGDSLTNTIYGFIRHI